MSNMHEMKCDKCGATYDLNSAAALRYICVVNLDGGGTCRGQIRAQPVKAQGIDTSRSTGAGVGRASAVPALLNPTAPLITLPEQAAQAIAPILGRVSMSRGGSFPGGAVTATVLFKNADDRAEFANAVILCGGSVSA